MDRSPPASSVHGIFLQKYWSFPGHVTVEAGKYEIYVSGLYLETQARLLCHSVIPNFFPISVFDGNLLNQPIVYVNHICRAPSQQQLEECLTKCPGPQPSQQDAQSWPTLWLTPLLSSWHNTLQWLMIGEVLGFVCHSTFSQTTSSGSSVPVPLDETHHLFICPHVCLHLFFFFN